ncbi:MAG: hypothetical protein N3D74_06755, partial [Caldisericia bacterium]|nr:hypothetical protein [Caldisericia bacterium]
MRVRIRYFTNKESYGRIFYLPQNINHTLFPTFGLQLNYEQNEENIIRKIYNRCLENPAPFDVNWKERYFCYFGNLENIRYFSHYIEIENKQIFSQIQNLISNYNKFNSFEYKIGGKIFDSRKKYVMGILNVTSDSFYDGGKYFD